MQHRVGAVVSRSGAQEQGEELPDCDANRRDARRTWARISRRQDRFEGVPQGFGVEFLETATDNHKPRADSNESPKLRAADDGTARVVSNQEVLRYYGDGTVLSGSARGLQLLFLS